MACRLVHAQFFHRIPRAPLWSGRRMERKLKRISWIFKLLAIRYTHSAPRDDDLWLLVKRTSKKDGER